MQFGSVAEWFGAFGSWAAGLGSLAAAWVALYLGLTANHAKLKAKGMFDDFFGIQIEIENTGSKEVIIRHIEVCRVKKRGITLFGRKRECKSCKVVYSHKKTEMFPAEPGFYEPPVISLSGDDPSNFLEPGKSTSRCVPQDTFQCGKNELGEIASTKKQAKSVEFVVCTDYGKFPVKSEKSLKKFVVSEFTSAIGRNKQNADHQLENNENPFS
ncbi:MAG: hypothetical protein MPK09_05455 [Gammaproteobacteria bacterium]|nr:hypothetical protein [Gammaproteobacteria bacterium]